METTH
jgi:exonuclease III